LLILSKWAADSVRLQYMKPLETEHTVTVTMGSDGAGSLDATSSIYKNKLRRNQVSISASIKSPKNEHGTFIIPGNTGGVQGRRAPLNISRELGSSNQVVGKVLSKGRDILTKADEKKAAAVLKMLQGEEDFGNIWVTNIWDPPNGMMKWSDSHTYSPPITVPEVPNRPLNSSQIFAIAKMLSLGSDNRIILIRGPPGSGKTSVISRFVEIATASAQYPGLWLVAQSNVAVKNIAEKLASIGYMNWKLLVSKDFIFDWHEHLYGSGLQSNLISSDQFKTYQTSELAGCKVILCTLSMLSNSQITKFTRYIPIHTLIVDEASQIEVGNFLPVLFTAERTLQKLCFIGDDKQLPPHGQEEIQDLKSVFEIDHFHDHIYLLDTQYRMPPQMGVFISSAVYDGSLKSNPHHVITDRTLACQFIHVPGVEILKGKSFIVGTFFYLFSFIY
ncbi:P-loop containing nucleoside triphosphate hydrolase protein, partial [Lentinula aff. lateritia]